MHITFDEDDVLIVAKAMAKSRRIQADFDRPWRPCSLEDEIHTEACRVVAALRERYGA